MQDRATTVWEKSRIEVHVEVVEDEKEDEEEDEEVGRRTGYEVWRLYFSSTSTDFAFM